jgi:hypothetical protein
MDDDEVTRSKPTCLGMTDALLRGTSCRLISPNKLLFDVHPERRGLEILMELKLYEHLVPFARGV